MVDSETMQEIIEYLQGTCNSLTDACATFGVDEDSLSDENLQQLDDSIFECEGCGWWYPIDEMEDPGKCECCSETEQTDWEEESDEEPEDEE